MMNSVLVVLLVVALLLVLGTLAAGLVTMGRGGELGPRQSNSLMRYCLLYTSDAADE